MGRSAFVCPIALAMILVVLEWVTGALRTVRLRQPGSFPLLWSLRSAVNRVLRYLWDEQPRVTPLLRPMRYDSARLVVRSDRVWTTWSGRSARLRASRFRPTRICSTWLWISGPWSARIRSSGLCAGASRRVWRTPAAICATWGGIPGMESNSARTRASPGCLDSAIRGARSARVVSSAIWHASGCPSRTSIRRSTPCASTDGLAGCARATNTACASRAHCSISWRNNERAIHREFRSPAGRPNRAGVNRERRAGICYSEYIAIQLRGSRTSCDRRGSGGCR